ncbi:MAG: 50S ribosomal protein L23 [Candidatus Woesearchaeota archaeon]|jgi:large subunit ribosomal protein L23Ae|nr:50S ribosomal protein L23 [Candidatus Woesearchaeota archaeon]
MVKRNDKVLGNDFNVIKCPLSTEKSIRLMESNNTLIFLVEKRANKQQIKKAIETVFKAKVVNVNTLIRMDGKKRAYVKFSNETPAIDIATQLGLM